MQKLPIIATYILVTIATGIFLAVAIPKIFFPYEMHWMEGSMVEQVSRILQGKSLYPPPTIYYVPWLYEPLYYYLTAAIASITGLSFEVARIPSVLATICTLVMLFIVVRKETGKMYLGIGSVGLYLAAYGKVEYCFVMARIDPLFNMLLVAGFIAIYYSSSSKGIVLGASLLVLSYFTKQTALVFIPSIAIYLWRIRGWKPALLFSITCAIFIAAGIFILDKVYDGWFSYYTLRVPQGKGKTLRWEYAFNGLFLFIILRCWLVTTILSLVTVRMFISKKTDYTSKASLFFGLFFLISIVAGFLGILNQGGGHNVLLPVAAACALFLPVLIKKLVTHTTYTVALLCLIPIQIAFLLANPWKDPRNIAMKIDKDNQEAFFAYIASLPGEIWINYHGYTQQYTGKQSYAELNALHDVVLVNDSASNHLQYQLDTAFLFKHWSFIFSDLLDTIPHYTLYKKMLNLNKVRMNDDTSIYIYRPEE